MTEHMRITTIIMLAAGIVLISGMLASVGCQEPTERLNAPPQGYSEHPSDLQDPFMAMTDNALLEEMSVSSVHFVPERPFLNGLGVRRLKRMANILKIYGGAVRYDGLEEDASLAALRIEEIEGFLCAEGVESNQITVERGLAGGKGIDATESIGIRKASRFTPECGTGTQTPSLSAAGPQ